MAGVNNSDERQPLLAASNSPHNTISDLPDEELPGAGLDVRDKKRNWKKIAIQCTLVLVGAAILGVFIKGFLDADDIEVCHYVDHCYRSELTMITSR